MAWPFATGPTRHGPGPADAVPFFHGSLTRVRGPGHMTSGCRTW